MLVSCSKLFTFRNVFGTTKFPVLSFVCRTQRHLSIDKNDVEQYQQDGVICFIRRCFSQYWVGTVKRGIQKVFDNPSRYSHKVTSEGGKGVYFNDYLQWKNVDEFHDYVYYSPAAEVAATFMREENCSIWMPVNPVEAKAGMQFIKGSHRWGKWFMPRYFETAENYVIEKNENQRHYDTVLEVNEKEHEILSWDMEPGDCLVFHMRTVHGGYPTSKNTSRQTLVTRWLGSDATLARRPWKTSPPKRPSDITFGNLMKNSQDFSVFSLSERRFID